MFGREVPEENDVDRAVVRGAARWFDFPIIGEGLTGFGIAFEPVVVLRLGERFGEWAEGLFEGVEGEAGRFAGSAGGEADRDGDN